MNKADAGVTFLNGDSIRNGIDMWFVRRKFDVTRFMRLKTMVFIVYVHYDLLTDSKMRANETR